MIAKSNAVWLMQPTSGQQMRWTGLREKFDSVPTEKQTYLIHPFQSNAWTEKQPFEPSISLNFAMPSSSKVMVQNTYINENIFLGGEDEKLTGNKLQGMSLSIFLCLWLVFFWGGRLDWPLMDWTRWTLGSVCLWITCNGRWLPSCSFL